MTGIQGNTSYPHPGRWNSGGNFPGLQPGMHALEAKQRITAGQYRILLPPAAVFIDPGTVRFLQVKELLGQLRPPVDTAAVGKLKGALENHVMEYLRGQPEQWGFKDTIRQKKAVPAGFPTGTAMK